MLLQFTFVFKHYAAINLVYAKSAFNVKIYLAMKSSSNILFFKLNKTNTAFEILDVSVNNFGIFVNSS